MFSFWSKFHIKAILGSEAMQSFCFDTVYTRRHFKVYSASIRRCRRCIGVLQKLKRRYVSIGERFGRIFVQPALTC